MLHNLALSYTKHVSEKWKEILKFKTYSFCIFNKYISEYAFLKSYLLYILL